MASVQPEAGVDPSKPTKAAEPTVHTYHCICSQLMLATTTNADELPKRTSDKSSICALPETNPGGHFATLVNTSLDTKPTVIRLEDGFEKRYFEKCARCELIVGYHLDKSQYEESKNQSGCRENVVYLLPGGLMSTEDMKAGKRMDQEIAKITAKA